MKDKISQKEKKHQTKEEHKEELTLWVGQTQPDREQSLLDKKLGQWRGSMIENLLQQLLLIV